MRKSFIEYYQPTEEEFNEMWNQGIFIVDANVLLNLYRYTSITSSRLLNILKTINDRLWLPHQVGLEYQRNRLKVIQKQTDSYKDIIDLLRNIISRIENDLNSFKKHPFLNVEGFFDKISRQINSVIAEIQRYEKDHQDISKHDTIRDEISTIFDGKVGIPYSESALIEIIKDGEKRYQKKIPPGFEDAKRKNDNREYGDLILWKQIIDYAIKAKKPIIFITDDRKEDWWYEFNGKTIGPRIELIREVYDNANVSFYMYKPDVFIEYAQKYFNIPIEDSTTAAIKEIQEVRAQERIIDKQDIEMKMKKLADSYFQLDELSNEIKTIRNNIHNLEGQILIEKDIEKATEKKQEKVRLSIALSLFEERKKIVEFSMLKDKIQLQFASPALTTKEIIDMATLNPEN